MNLPMLSCSPFAMLLVGIRHQGPTEFLQEKKQEIASFLGNQEIAIS
jgi:hypothetical protein